MTRKWRTAILAAAAMVLSAPAFAQTAAQVPLEPEQVLPEVAHLPVVAAAPLSTTDALTVADSGRVGIGTATPAAPLHIVTASGTDAKLTMQGSGGNHLELAFLDNLTLAGRLIGSTGNAAGFRYFGFIAYDDKDGNRLPIRFFTKGSDGILRTALWLSSNFPGTLPRIGIGTTSAPIHPIQVANGAYLSAGGVWQDASSRQLKEDIRELTLDEARATLDGLVPIHFKYLTEEGDYRLGFIAEDVPELVASADRTTLSPMDFVAILTRIVQDQQAKIDELENARSQLEEVLRRLDRQEAEIQALRAPVR